MKKRSFILGVCLMCALVWPSLVRAEEICSLDGPGSCCVVSLSRGHDVSGMSAIDTQAGFDSFVIENEETGPCIVKYEGELSAPLRLDGGAMMKFNVGGAFKVSYINDKENNGRCSLTLFVSRTGSAYLDNLIKNNTHALCQGGRLVQK